MGKPVQVDSDQLALLTAAHKMLADLHGDSKVGMQFKKLVKEKFPTAAIPELEINNSVETLAKSLTERIEKFEAERAKEKQDAELSSLQSRFDAVVKDRGYTEE